MSGGPPDANLAASFLSHAESRPDEIFLRLTNPVGAVEFTYAELRDLCFVYNAHFRAAGLGKGAVVAIILTHGVDLYGAFVGAVMAGRTPTIMPFPTPKQDKARYWSSHASCSR